MINILNHIYVENITDKSERVRKKIKNDKIIVEKQKHSKKTIPNVIGMGVKDAIFLLENREIQVKIEGKGKIVSQSLDPGSIIKEGSIIKLQLK